MSKPKYEIRKDLFCPFCGHQGMRPLCDSHKAQSGKRRYSCQGCRKRTTNPLYSEPQLLPKTKITEVKKHKFFVIVSAVNDTDLVQAAHETFRNLAETNNGCLLVIPTVYKNPDLKHEGITDNYSWPEEILPYICNANVKLNNNIVIKGETRIEHCVINPLAGVNHAGDITSEVYGHAQVAMEMVATSQQHMPKMLHTTGTISQPNYGGSMRAQKAKFHHSISALVVETEGDKFWTHEVHFDGTGAYFFDQYYTPDTVTDGHPAAGVVYGDVHARFLDPKIEKQLEKANDLLQPEHKVFHDVHDQHIGSHHHRDDVLFKLSKAVTDEFSVRKELMMSVRFLEKHPGCYVVDSNHHRHLDQWFNRFIPKNDVVNMPLYFELAEMARHDLSNGGDGNLFRLFIQRYCSAPVTFVDDQNPLVICDIDCSQHGDRGPKGSRGSAKAFAKSGHKTMIGHGHGPRIEKGCYQVGVMTTDLPYARFSFSDWAITHGIIYPNGKRGLFTIVKNKLPPSMRR